MEFRARVIREPHEGEVPANWNGIVVASFSTIANSYSEGVKADPRMKQLDDSMDAIVAQEIKERLLTRLLEIGVGDGERLISIRQKLEDYPELELYGTDLSDSMLALATSRGIFTEKHDMRKPLPFSSESMDAVLYAKGDFGYIMHPENGEQMRVKALKSAYSTVRPGGILVLDLISDDRRAGSKGRAMEYERTPVIEEEDQKSLPFWIKQFRLGEVRQLFEQACQQTAQE